MSGYDKATDEALDVVAVKYTSDLMLQRANVEDWENYPELGENDFREVVARVRKMATAEDAFPTDAEFGAAYALLSKRADGVEA